MIPPRKKKHAAKVSLIASLIFHVVVIGALAWFAAREGLLGKQLKTIAVSMAPKEKKPEPEKPKEPEKKPDPEIALVVKGARSVDYQYVISVLDLLQQLDLNKVGLATETVGGE
jgi:hypothetical protein